jgi:polysaccharide biosynthesis transport protein
MKVLARYYPQYVSPRTPSAPPGQSEESAYYYSDQEHEKHLRDYWKILLKRLRVVVPVFLGVLALGLLYIIISPTQYTAKSTLKIEPQNPSFTGIAETAPTQSEMNRYDYYQTQFALLKNAPMAARVIKKLDPESKSSLEAQRFNLISWITNSIYWGIDSIAELFRTQSTGGRPAANELGVPPALVSRYRSYLTIEPVKNTRLVDISFSTPNPRLSQQLANAHATSFIQMVLESHFNLTQEARDFLTKKLADLREKVITAEKALNQFRQQHGVVSMEKGENIVVDRLVDLNKQLTQSRSARIQAESLYQMTRNKNTEYLAQVLSSPVVVQIKTSLATLETEKGRLLSIYTPEHPRLQELNQQITEAKRTLAGEVANIVRGIESNYNAARGQEQALEAEAKKQQDTALDLKNIAVDYAVLNEGVVANRGLYETILKRMNDTNVANDLAASNIQVVQQAEQPTKPSSPNIPKILTASVVLGLLLSLALAFFLEYMDATMNTPQQVWAAVSLATLGVVPRLELGTLRQSNHPPLSDHTQSNHQSLPNGADDRVGKEIVLARAQFSIVAESYRNIRTALLLSQAERPPKVILVTSPCPGEGKTVTSVNLGMALAQSGKKVLIIDADMRKGRCHHLLHRSNQEGLANVLAGQVEVKRSIQETSVKDFYLLPRGSLPPNPADLLMSQRMSDLLTELRTGFDCIVLDSPPIIAVSDAAVLATLCDGAVLVFDGQKTTTHSAKRALEVLDNVGARILGVILNGVDILHNPEYVDYRSYYSSYYPTEPLETD